MHSGAKQLPSILFENEINRHARHFKIALETNSRDCMQMSVNSQTTLLQ